MRLHCGPLCCREMDICSEKEKCHNLNCCFSQAGISLSDGSLSAHGGVDGGDPHVACRL